MAADLRIGTRIARRRQVLGMTQQELAAALRVSKSTVANWENGKHFPLRKLGKIEAVLGIRLDSDPGRPPLSERARRVLAEELTPEDYRRVIGLIEKTLTEPGAEPGEEESRG